MVKEQSRFLVEFVVELKVGHLPFGNLQVLGAIDCITEVPLILLIDVPTIVLYYVRVVYPSLTHLLEEIVDANEVI